MHPDRPPKINRQAIILPVYYKEVPEFNPDTPEGKRWYKDKLETLGEQGFAQEYEIDFSCADGRLAYPLHNREIHVLRRPIKLDPGWRYAFAIDPGVNVTAALFACIAYNGLIFLFDRYYAGDAVKGSEARSAFIHAKHIIEQAQRLTDMICGADKYGGSTKKWDNLFYDVLIDPRHGYRRADDMSTVADSYDSAGIHNHRPATTDVIGSIEIVKKLEEPHLDIVHPEGIVWYNDSGEPMGAPMKYSFPHLAYDEDVNEEPGYYIQEKENYRLPTKDKVLSGKNQDMPIKKDDHLMDNERHICAYFYDDAPVQRVEKRKPTKMDIEYRNAKMKPGVKRKFKEIFV